MAFPPLTAELPSVEEPARNVTVPVAERGETIAVKVTLWPVLICVAEAVNEVVVATTVCVTVTVTAADTELELVVLPS